MRVLALFASIVVGGCRLHFDAAAEAPADTSADVPVEPVEFGRGCAVGLRMDEAAWTGAPGEVIDACGGDDNGVAVERAQRADDRERGAVGEFPAPSGCVRIADAPALHATTELTLSAWIYPLALDGINPFGVIAKRSDFTVDDAEYTMFVWTGNTVWVDLDGRNDRNHGTRPLINGAWQQLTVVFDGSLPAPQRVAIYLDGALDAVVAESSASLAPRPNALSIGCLPELPATKPQLALAGRIDDAAVWTRAFTASEVAAWYAATRH